MTWFETVYWFVQLLALISWIALPIGLWRIKTKRIRTFFLLIIIFVNGLLTAFWAWDQRSVPSVNPSLAAGNFWDIETVFQAEPNVSSRAWKRAILEELSTNLNHYRRAKNLAPVPQGIVESFSPDQLYRLRQQNPDAVQLLDVREAYERNKYGLPGSVSYRYGDLANNLKPNLDPSQKVVVVCYSGIRGYLVANLLTQLGFKHAGFIRGGLEAWNEAALPAEGAYDDFEFLAQAYDRLTLDAVTASSAIKINFQVNSADTVAKMFSNMKVYNGELLTSAEVKSFTDSLNQAPVILLCETESECYDARMFGYNYEVAGGEILGYYEF